MNTKKTVGENDVLDKQPPSFSKTRSNYESISPTSSKQTKICHDQIQCYLRKYFSTNHFPSMTDFINRQTFADVLRSSGLVIDDACLQSLWNSCHPSDRGVSYEKFCQQFGPLKLENHRNSFNSPRKELVTDNECRVLNYTTRISDIVKKCWQIFKEELSSLDRHGRLFITTEQAINLMRKYSFPLNEHQQCELALLFSPKNSGQFKYYDFLQYFTNQLSSTGVDQGIFARSTYIIQSKQSWTTRPITIDDIIRRIRLECLKTYQSVHRMFRTLDTNRQGYLTKMQFNQLLKQFQIRLNEEELYHVMSEIDRGQDGNITYDKLYCSLIFDTLQI